MNRTRIMPRICFLSSAALSVIGAVLRTVCLLTCFDTDVGYFRPSALPTVSDILYIVAFVLVTAGALLIPKKALSRDLCAPHRTVPAILFGAILVLFAATALVVCFPDRTGPVLLAPIILAPLAAVYFFLSANRSGLYPDGIVALGFLPILWCVAGIAETYMDRFTTMNSPVKLALQLGMIGLTFILLAELRFRLGKAIPRGAVAYLGIGTYACLTASVPVLVATAVGVLDNTLHMLYAAVLLAGGLYGLYLLFCHTCLSLDEPDDCPTDF